MRLRMTLKEPLSGDAPLVEEWEEGGVGLLEEAGIMARRWQVAGVQEYADVRPGYDRTCAKRRVSAGCGEG